MQSLLRRILLFIFSPILIFIFGDEQQVLHSKLKDDSYFGNKGSSLNSKLPFTNNPITGQNISQDLYTELEELARIADVSYCVGYSGIQPPFKCLGRCAEFPTFQLVEVCSSNSTYSIPPSPHPPFLANLSLSRLGILALFSQIRADMLLFRTHLRQNALLLPLEGHIPSPTPSQTYPLKNKNMFHTPPMGTPPLPQRKNAMTVLCMLAFSGPGLKRSDLLAKLSRTW